MRTTEKGTTTATAGLAKPTKKCAPAKSRQRLNFKKLEGSAKAGSTAELLDPAKPRALGHESGWISTAGAYHAGKGVYRNELIACRTRIPGSGPCVGTSNELDYLRRAVNCYYDAYNNGGMNLEDTICEIFPITRSSISACNTIAAIDETLDRLILEAYRAENARVSFEPFNEEDFK